MEILKAKKLRNLMKQSIKLLLLLITIPLANGAPKPTPQATHTDEELYALLINENAKVSGEFFAPDDNLEELLVFLINHEKKSIRTALYLITNHAVAKALANAVLRGVMVSLVADKSWVLSRFSQIPYLQS